MKTLLLFDWKIQIFSIRAKNNGFKLIYNGKVKVVHFEGVSTEKYAKRKDLTENINVFFIQRRNMLYFLLKHYGVKALLFQVPLILFDSVFSITYLKPRKDFLSRVLFIIHEVVKQIVNYSVSRGNYEVQ